MLAKVIDWLDRRASIKHLWHEAADEKIPGGARPRYVFGSVLMFLFMQQVVLGILLATYYSPSATDAWASTAYINDHVTAGWFLRGLHHHGSSAMVIVTVLHFLQVTFAGAYRAPRELNWLTGLLMAALVLGFALTGYLLPWDQKGYWATQVATSIMGSMPAGDVQQRLLQGGSQYGNLTITRFFALHVFVLPIGLAALLGAHLALFRKHGVTPPVLPQAELDRTTEAFFPKQLFLDMVAMAVTAAILVIVNFNTHGSELFAPAQPASNFVARPEWYFLFLFQLLKYFHGPSQIIATAIIPGAAATFLVLMPWIDKAESRSAKDRLPVLAGVAALMAGVTALTALAINEDKHNEKYQAGLVVAVKEAEYARELAKKGVLPGGGDAVFENDPQVAAKRLFKESCSNCHAIDGVGGSEAPDFGDYNSRAWLSAMIRNPMEKRFFGGTKHEDEMTPYPPNELSDEQLKQVVEFVLSISAVPPKDLDAALAKQGGEIFSAPLNCGDCHEVELGKHGSAPNLAKRGGQEWIASVIRDSGQEHLFGDNGKMPKFGQKLSADQIQRLAELIYLQQPSATPTVVAAAAHE
ncbi:MAG TPA: cytochrome b N-terminal domain-containing protein [Polyangiaceae bacterium]|nr:cytochrome b N-terminal domain-containing protein [Polyangiaceae bacterium]